MVVCGKVFQSTNVCGHFFSRISPLKRLWSRCGGAVQSIAIALPDKELQGRSVWRKVAHNPRAMLIRCRPPAVPDHRADHYLVPMTKGEPIRRTKIVATLGPAWESEEQMHALLEAGVDLIRVNASHGTPEIRESWIRRIQKVREQRRSATGILVDLHGPRIRVGKLPEPI